MHKTKFLAIAVILILAMVIPAAADQWELGMSLTPLGAEPGTDPDPEAEENGFVVPGFHIGYRFLLIGYVSWDSYVLPPEYITQMTSNVSNLGPFRPGFLNTWNIGGKLVLGPVIGYSTIGLNSIYVYKESEYLDESFDKNFGANWKVGAGLKFGDWGIHLDFMSIFSDARTMFSDLDDLFNDDQEISDAAADRIKFIPSLVATLYL
ncbi:MAG: hypothetical protein PF693_01630 [Spirochaetia bacterium]|jgi:hypothetical protein|nr:hypothetical protein [Spirochaetia bacterium]